LLPADSADRLASGNREASLGDRAMAGRRFALSAKVLVRDEHGRVLLLKRSANSKNNRGKWDLPGGKVDTGESFDEALLREVAEETGLTVSLVGVAGAAESDLPDRKVVYLLMEGNLTSGEVRLSDEHNEFAWVERSRLAAVDVCEQFRSFLEAYGGQAG